MRRFLQRTLFLAAIGTIGFLTGCQLFARSEDIYTYRYSQDQENCGASGMCNLSIYKNKYPIFSVETWEPPLFQENGKYVSKHKTWTSKKKENFVIFELDPKCQGPQYQCDVYPVFYKPNFY